ncbi:MAG TPA: acylphosphatase [Gammaproteobacteria bacterium]
MTRTAVRYLVSGRVQGVFYRASAASEARRLGLAGWARNLPDGRVEVVAAGDRRAVEALCAWLWKGPPAARVDGVTAEEWTGGDVGPGFDVR